ncbi:hypothetical protein OHB26_20425 [Nocardia sp. NBC_01503]|uniref:hypothetical protein n=1 Tax=Nocardia sp. NBC_01503 TaxID=2975997 RepID=UPI002E7B26B5|nr:hypothetical protein [Nocardia sp. NBC_01503]WTL29373.1 hypothetical protein OHB26_20425 [Nocardia sp. NBC_01503]
MRPILRLGVLALGIGAAALTAGVASAEIPLVDAPAAEVTLTPGTNPAPIASDDYAMCSKSSGSAGHFLACM